MKFELPGAALIEKEQRRAFLSFWLRRIFLEDWLMKVVALAITLALWVGVTGMRTPITRRVNNVSLSPLIAKDLEITNSLQPEVDIEISGDKRKIDLINGRDLAVTLDLTDLGEGDRTIQLTPQGISVELPSGVTVTKISPEKIAVKLEQVEEADVPVRVEVEGTLADGYEVYSETPTPAKVRVRGPKSFVEALSFVATEKISLKGRKTGFVEAQVPLNISDPKISLVDSVRASVSIQIGRKRIERLLVIDYETETRSGRANILLFGPDTVLETLSPQDVIIAETKSADGKLRLEVLLPDSIKSEVKIRSVKYRE